jgi:hypothetical protein
LASSRAAERAVELAQAMREEEARRGAARRSQALLDEIAAGGPRRPSAAP